MTPDRLTLTQAAAEIGCSRRTVERYVASGKLPAIDVAPPGASRPALRVDADVVERLRIGRPLAVTA